MGTGPTPRTARILSSGAGARRCSPPRSRCIRSCRAGAGRCPPPQSSLHWLLRRYPFIPNLRAKRHGLGAVMAAPRIREQATDARAVAHRTPAVRLSGESSPSTTNHARARPNSLPRVGRSWRSCARSARISSPTPLPHTLNEPPMAGAWRGVLACASLQPGAWRGAAAGGRGTSVGGNSVRPLCWARCAGRVPRTSAASPPPRRCPAN